MDKELWKDIVKFIVSIPALLISCIISLFSGHIWLWIIYTYFDAPPKSSTYLKSIWAKIGLGLLWYSLFLFPAYWIKFGIGTPVDSNVSQLVGLTLIVGSFVQAISTILIVKFKKSK